MKLKVPIVIEEYAGIDRNHEPVTLGAPIPRGSLVDGGPLVLLDPEFGEIPVQTATLAKWPDGSVKWLLIDFQATISASATKKFSLELREDRSEPAKMPVISILQKAEILSVNTGGTIFEINTAVFKPFERVVVDGEDYLAPGGCLTLLTTTNLERLTAKISSFEIETEGPLRVSIRFEGQFHGRKKVSFANFIARLHFFGSLSLVKIDFAIWNPSAARHAGGLWDLGDPGSVYFEDLSLFFPSRTEADCAANIVCYDESENNTDALFPKQSDNKAGRSIRIYQDSSGGVNWNSPNHVNRFGEVKTSFRGYRVYCDDLLCREGYRTQPTIYVKNNSHGMALTIEHFWQNFPKALEAENGTLIGRLFPKYFNDAYELQAGERKTHSMHLCFYKTQSEPASLHQVHARLSARSTPNWYASSEAIPYLVSESDHDNNELKAYIKCAIQGDSSFFSQREIIDEYGWRHFGDLYANHESVGKNVQAPLVSHYNNQYDCIYSFIRQFCVSSDPRWYLLADSLCKHSRDIDIYHTDRDRPEYNHGLFWHTSHYLDARTATHRCFSEQHGGSIKLNNYGGGPSLSHCYSTGFLYHYCLTGDPDSRKSVLELAQFVRNNLRIDHTFSNMLFRSLKDMLRRLKNTRSVAPLVQLDKVYGLNGPGRAGGNALNTLLDAYCLTEAPEWIIDAEKLIACCIHPDDDIESRNLLDVENRWMYTVFLQALCRYIDLKLEIRQWDSSLDYARQALLAYADWMMLYERPYLENPEKLEFPNETWAAQDLRKCHVFIKATFLTESRQKHFEYQEKARFFFAAAIGMLNRFESKTLTRPLVLVMQNSPIYIYFLEPESFVCEFGQREAGKKRASGWTNSVSVYHKAYFTRLKRTISSEFDFIKWRLPW
jgi:hypothetical protein